MGQKLAVFGHEQLYFILGFRAIDRKVIGADDTFKLREDQAPYGKSDDSGCENIFFRNSPV